MGAATGDLVEEGWLPVVGVDGARRPAPVGDAPHRPPRPTDSDDAGGPGTGHDPFALLGW